LKTLEEFQRTPLIQSIKFITTPLVELRELGIILSIVDLDFQNILGGIPPVKIRELKETPSVHTEGVKNNSSDNQNIF
jgi:hypothetical protein